MGSDIVMALQWLLSGVDGPVLIHSDMFKVSRLVDVKILGRDVFNICNQHANFLLSAIAKRNLIVPTFNYDFPKEKIFDVQNTPSQLGKFTEHFRCYWAKFRTPVPVFSFCSNDVMDINKAEIMIKPFDENSVFARLYEEDGCILYYGSTFSCTTFIHYIESYFDNLIYRYNKFFYGKVIDAGYARDITLCFHVRPGDHYLDYDYARMFSDLKNAGFVKWINLPGFDNIFMIKAEDMLLFFIDKLKVDPFYFLNVKSKEWIIPLYTKIKRKFSLEDFERC